MAKRKHSWNYENIGGSTRVKITTGADIAHLDELDIKKWTVLSCPVTGLDIEDKSLKYIDVDCDGRIRVSDVVATSKWLASVVKDVDLLVKGTDSIDISMFNQENADGRILRDSARQILVNLGKEGTVISLADTKDTTSIFSKTAYNGDGVITVQSSSDDDEKAAISAILSSLGGVMDRSGEVGVNAGLIEVFYKAMSDFVEWNDAAVEAPYGADTDSAIEAYNALDLKIKDYFVRSKLASFSPESAVKLDVQSGLIEAISADNLTGKTDEIAAYPIARITGKAELEPDAAINPAWASKFNALMAIMNPGGKVITEDTWAAMGASFASYKAWRAAKKGCEVEALGLDTIKKLLADDKKQALLDLVAQDLTFKEAAEGIDMVDKFLHVYRDFYRLVCNFVTFHDFYSRNKSVKAIFQSGRLVIDQRECRMCMRVSDMAQHNNMAPASGMYLVYCDCTTKLSPAKQTIVAAITVGDIGDLMVGKNAIYYDNSGQVWDAVITKIVDNPISIGQAFWSPYRRMANAIENLINKSAADKDAEIMKDIDAKINAAPAAAAAPEGEAAPAQPFDIGKYAGIFAAIGMAAGMIATAISSIFKGVFDLSWWQLLAVFVGILLIISGPSMVMAWMKLRRRNIAPLLNANGWAINASSRISIPFGETLTDVARFPKLKLKDPYARKSIPTWLRWVLSLLTLAVVVAGLWLGNLLSFVGAPSPLPFFNKEQVVEQVDGPLKEPVVEQAVAVEPVEETQPTEAAAEETAEATTEGA
ncbi:MAG: hypothetical protein J6U62_05200 [Bacteroidaceae bacterium]|nr:hypothetical protein [Bacteroidaceae bacterium]